MDSRKFSGVWMRADDEVDLSLKLGLPDDDNPPTLTLAPAPKLSLQQEQLLRCFSYTPMGIQMRPTDQKLEECRNSPDLPANHQAQQLPAALPVGSYTGLMERRAGRGRLRLPLQVQGGDDIDDHEEDQEADRRCTNLNCNTDFTPMWRKGPLGPKTLCNACGIKYRKDEEKRRAKQAAAAKQNPNPDPDA